MSLRKRKTTLGQATSHPLSERLVRIFGWEHLFDAKRVVKRAMPKEHQSLQRPNIEVFKRVGVVGFAVATARLVHGVGVRVPGR